MRPPGRSKGHSARSICACTVASWAMSSSRRSHRTSGWRRTIPEAVQGASSKMPSNSTPSHQACGFAASPWRTWACRPKRCKLAWIFSRRWASLSIAKTWASASSSKWAVLPPGAAQASKMRGRAPRPCNNKGAAHCAAASCTATRPCAKPGRRATGTALSSTMAAPCAATAPIPASCRRCK